ncbi:MAG: pilus assembly protein [Anaerolineales bacterium]|nr:pilus assembly protein [Anaerolineales bacterium]
METNNVNHSERGQSMVELAISLTFLFILLAGVVDLGRAFFTYIALRDAAQEGASYATVVRDSYNDPMACNAIEARARSTSNTPVDLSDTTDISVTINIGGMDCSSASAANACFGNGAEVIVAFENFPITMPFLGAIIGSNTVSLSAQVEDTILTPACQ